MPSVFYHNYRFGEMQTLGNVGKLARDLHNVFSNKFNFGILFSFYLKLDGRIVSTQSLIK